MNNVDWATVEYENAFLKKHGLLPEQAIERLDELTIEYNTLLQENAQLLKDIEHLEQCI